MKVYLAISDDLGIINIRAAFSKKSYAVEFIKNTPPEYQSEEWQEILMLDVDKNRIADDVVLAFRATITKEGNPIIERIKLDPSEAYGLPSISINYDRQLEMTTTLMAKDIEAAKKEFISIRKKLIDSGQWVYRE